MTAHLRPDLWAAATRAMLAKALGEFAHERLIEPVEEGSEDGRYRVRTDDGETTYAFAARRGALDHWDVDPASIERRGPDGAALELDALAFALELRDTLGLAGETAGTYLEELTSTLAADAFKRSRAPMSAADLADADFQVIEGRMTEGHPCFVANSGRIGFGAEDYARFAPEAAAGIRLPWVAGHRDSTTFSAGAGLEYDSLLRDELGAETVARFHAVLTDRGLDPADYVLFPVHPWQWDNRLAVTFAGDVAQQRLVYLGEATDDYVAQQSIRTFFNATVPTRHYVKTALSVVNMGFIRGLSAKYMDGTPAINDWLAALVDGDEVLADARFEIIRERASVGYRSPHYDAAAAPRSPHPKMLASLWRESPVTRVRDGERLATMTSLLHVDADGNSLVGELIRRSGLTTREWLDRYLRAYLRPLVHCFYAHDLVFMPHGENLILVLRDHAVERVLMKDIAEEIVVMDTERELPDEVARIKAEVPDELRALSILTDVVDCFLRFLGPILVREGLAGDDELWQAVAACVAEYQADFPELADRYERWDLFAERFDLSCLNRLQLRDATQMVDLADPAGSLQMAGQLENPLAAYRPVASG